MFAEEGRAPAGGVRRPVPKAAVGKAAAWIALSLSSLLNACDGTPPPEMLEPPEPGLYADPRWLAFTCVADGCDTEATVRISVEGERSLAVKRIALSDPTRTDFEIVPDQSPPFILGVRENFTAKVRFRPNGDPRLSDPSLEIAYTDASTDEDAPRVPPGTLSVRLIRRQVGIPALVVSPSTLSFGAVRVGGEKSLPLRIENAGTGNVGLMIDRVESNAAALVIASSPLFAIPPRGHIELEVTYTPQEEALLEGALTIHPASGGLLPAVIPAIGTSMPGPRIEVRPGSIEFEELGRGRAATKSLEIRNIGSAELIIHRVAERDVSAPGRLSAKITGSSTIARVPSLASTAIDVRFEPTDSGEIHGMVRVESNDPTRGSIDIPVGGLVVHPRVSVEPRALDFGIVPRGWIVARTVEITNVGHGNLRITGASMVLGSSGLFTLRQVPSLPVKLGHGQRLAFDVEFRAETEAAFAGTLAIESTDDDQPVSTVSLNAKGAACEEGCPIANGSPSCSLGTCAVGACNAGWYDADRSAANGCECQERGTDPGSYCASAADLGTLSDTDQDRASFTGIVPSSDDVDVVRFFGADDTNFLSDDYDVRVTLESDDPSLTMCVYRHETSSRQNECFFEGEVCGRSYRKDGGSGDDSADYVVKIFRDASQTGTCLPYTIFVKNG